MELRETRLRERVADALRRAAQELGKPLIEVETNLRAFSDSYVSWSEEYDGSALASVALLLSAELGKVYIPASFSEAFLMPWGTHPHLDPLWSTEGTEIVHDGNQTGRPQKVARIAQSEAALRWLRVCWENRDQAYNCGRCEKCLRTMVNLRIAGALDRCPTFARPLDLRAVRNLVIPDECARIFVEENLEACRAAGTDPELEQALEACLVARPSRLRALVADGDLRRRALRKLRRSLGLPQTVYFRDAAERQRAQRLLGGHRRLTVIARERVSLELARAAFPDARVGLVPDLAFLLPPQRRRRRPEVDVIWLGRRDVETS